MNATLLESDRVRRNTCPSVNASIDRRLDRSLHRHAGAPRRMITARIRRLDREWDIERLLEVNASTIALAGLVAGVVSHRKWLLLPAAVLGFLCLHGLQGWCPPVPVFRRLGVRTRREIEREKFALKALRGDFAGVGRESYRRDPEAVRRAVNR